MIQSMEKKLPAKAKPGVIIKIPVKEGICGYGQLLENGHLAIFDYFNDVTVEVNLNELHNAKVIFSPVIFDTVKSKIINKGTWPTIGFAEINEKIIEQIKPRYHLNETNSALLFYNGEELENVDPESMYGLFPISVYNEQNVLKLLEAYLENRYSDSEILSMLRVYFRGQRPSDYIIPKAYFTLPRSKPLPKPDELDK